MRPARNTAFAACLWLAAAALPAAADDAVAKVTLEPQVVGLGETVTLTIELRSPHLSSLHFHPDFKLENLELASSASQYDNVQMVNGSFSRTFGFVWRLRPIAVGRAAVRSLRLQIGDELRQLPDREITVQEAPTGQADEPAGQEAQDPLEQLFGAPLFQRQSEPPRRPAVFLRAEVQPQLPYVGQQVLYTAYLYTRDDIASMAAREMPAFRGFWVRDVPLPQRLPTDMVTVGNQRYARVAVVQKALFPLRPGHYTIDPAAMDLMARVVESRWFAPPLARPQQVTVTAPAVALEVQPLPPAPPGFGGAVGQLALAARLDPAQLRLGEAATLTVTLAGRGNVQGVAEPRLALPPGLKLFPPQQQGDERVLGTAVQGTRTWSWVVVPERTGHATLTVPALPFFDPLSRQYRSASAPPVELTTLPPAVASTSAATLNSIRNAAAGPAQGGGGFSWLRLLPWLLAVPWGIALLVTLARRRRQPACAPGVFELAEQRFAAAAAETRSRQAAARLEEAWRDLLAERWALPPGTPAAHWCAELRGRGADPEAAAELSHLADDLHYLRYAPQLSASGTLTAEAIARSRRLLRRLR